MEYFLQMERNETAGPQSPDFIRLDNVVTIDMGWYTTGTRLMRMKNKRTDLTERRRVRANEDGDNGKAQKVKTKKKDDDDDEEKKKEEEEEDFVALLHHSTGWRADVHVGGVGGSDADAGGHGGGGGGVVNPAAGGGLPLRQVLVFQLRLDVDAAYRTPFVGGQPLVDALHVEQVHARQPAHVLAVLELAQTDRAPAPEDRPVSSPHHCASLHIGFRWFWNSI